MPSKPGFSSGITRFRGPFWIPGDLIAPPGSRFISTPTGFDWFLSNDYPVLRSFLGDELFGLLVEAYFEAMPSHYPNARDYGRRLPNFMRLTAPWSEGCDASDLARLERALSA